MKLLKMRTIMICSITLGLLLMGACNSRKKENQVLKDQISQLKAENDRFKEQGAQLSITVTNYKKFLNEIDANLKAIDENSTMVGQLRTEIKSGSSVEDRIKVRIMAITALMNNSRLKILALDKNLRELRKSASDKSQEIQELELELKAATATLMAKEQEFYELTESLEEDVEGLQNLYAEQVAITEELFKIVNRAFYIAAPSKELKDKGIVNAEGGFIGIGRVKVVNANSSEGLFTQIEKDNTDSLVLPGKKFKLISEHPAGSYEIKETKENRVLGIIDKQEFWKQGNYLVIQINN